MRVVFASLFCCFLLVDLSAQPANGNDALSQLNTIREAAKLPAFRYSPTLERSAQNHADYIAKNAGENYTTKNLHKQNSFKSSYTGVNAVERSAVVNYPSKDVKENISIGSKTLSKSMTSLMAAIYHRFTFLDFLNDTVGYGSARSNRGISNYVFNMGRADMENTCSTQPAIAEPAKPLDCLGTLVKPQYIENLCRDIPEEALFDEAFPYRCPNGRLLKASYMDEICKNPPKDILRTGSGRYYQICKPTIRVKTSWFNNICSSNNHPALHSGENRFYEICDNNTRVYVSWFKNFCDSATPQDQSLKSRYYLNLCHSDFKMRQDYRQELDQRQYQKSPQFVIWPPRNASDVSPVFYDEIPDPLPDLDVSGYPLSVQFNPGKVISAQIKKFTLERQNRNGSWSPVKAVRELNHNNDPHKTLTEFEYAWFPLQRLDWNRAYRATVTAITQDNAQKKSVQTISWAFKTKNIETPLIIVNAQQKQVDVPQNQWFTLYHVPSKSVSRPMKEISAAWRKPAKVKSTIIDMNTVKMKFENTRCEPVILSLSQRSDIRLNTCSGS